MAIALNLKLEGQRRVEQRLNALVHGIEHREELMDGFGEYLETSTRDRFDDGVDPDGNRWSDSWRVKTQGGSTLKDHRHLQDSISFNATNDQVEWGSNLIYARPNNDGAVITAKGGGRLTFKLPGNLGFRSVFSVTIPARPFMGVNAEDERQLIGIGEDYLSLIAAEGSA